MSKNGTHKQNKVTGAVTIVDNAGRTKKLLPTFEAALEIEDELGVGVDQLRNRAALGGIQAVALTTRELGLIVYVGLKAAGEEGVSRDSATRWVWEIGRTKLRPPLIDFLWALADGGRGRAEDLKNAGSPNGSLSAPNGGEEKTEATDELISELKATASTLSGS